MKEVFHNCPAGPTLKRMDDDGPIRVHLGPVRLQDGTEVGVSYAPGAGGGRRGAWAAPARYRVEASGGSLPFTVVLHVEHRRGRPVCARLEAGAEDDAGVTLARLKMVNVRRLIDAAAPQVLQHIVPLGEGHTLWTLPRAGHGAAPVAAGAPVSTDFQRAGRAARRQTPTDDELLRVHRAWQRASAERPGRPVPRALELLEDMSRSTYYRLRGQALERGLVSREDWPDTTTRSKA